MCAVLFSLSSCPPSLPLSVRPSGSVSADSALRRLRAQVTGHPSSVVLHTADGFLGEEFCGPIQPTRIPPLSTDRASWWSLLLLFSPRRSSITGLCLPDGPRNHLLSGAPALRGYRHVKLLLFGFRASGGVCGQVWWWPSCCASVVIGAGCIGLHALSRVFRSAL